MQLELSISDLIICLGIVQGLVTGVLLLNTPKNPHSNRFLALALFSFCFLSTKPLLHSFGLWEMAAFRFFPNGIELALPPLVFLYAKSLVNPAYRFGGKDWWHFLPFFLSQTWAFVVYFAALSAPNLVEKDAISEALHFNALKQTDEYLLLVSVALYLLWGHRELTLYKKWMDDNTSDTTHPDFTWLRDIFRLSLVLEALLLTNHLLDLSLSLGQSTRLHWVLVNLFIAFQVYYLGLRGYLQPNFDFSRSEEAPDSPQSGAEESQVSELAGRLGRFMEKERVYLNPKLSIRELAVLLEVPEKSLSAAINQHFGLHFRDFINRYRVEEVKARLEDPDHQHLSLLGIGLECGFNSEASFYRIFKKHTGRSPREYLRQKNDSQA